MPESDPDLVRRTAALARLDVTDEDVARLGADFANILAAFEGLAAVDVEGVDPLVGMAAAESVTRPDEVRPSLDRDAALAPAPDRRDEFFGVPKTLGGDS